MVNKRYAYVDFENTEKYIASTKLMVLRCNLDRVLPRFLFAFLTSNDTLTKLQHLAETRSGTFPQITFSSELSSMQILVPSLTTQQKIASILSSLDYKIELNNRINENLEAQAFAIFNSMFPNVIYGDKTIGEYIVPQKGKSLTAKNAIRGNIPVIAGGTKPATYHNIANTKPPVVTIAASGTAGFVNIWHVPIWSSDSSFIDATMTKHIYFWYLVLKTRQQEIYQLRTGSVQAHIYPQHIAEMPISHINLEQVNIFTEKISSLFKLIGLNIEENEHLAEIRDTLLPRLMSSELDVSDLDI